jgi:hypothetical protein
MCSPARCGRCGKITWTGCGAHVDEVMCRVPTDQRCTCEPEPRQSLFDRLRHRH